tara:strand:- start:317 stop:673 length:357 start_codon:yes stop_codon:yes gene_type:complete
MIFVNPEVTIGYIGSILVTFCMLPQVYKTYKTKNVEGLSISFIILQILSSVCYIIYAMYEKTLPIMISNCATVFLSLILIILYYRYYEFGIKTPLIPTKNILNGPIDNREQFFYTPEI